MKEITNKQLRSKLEQSGLGHVHLIKGDGYFYIVSDEKNFNECSIYLNAFNHQSIDAWVRDITELANNY